MISAASRDHIVGCIGKAEAAGGKVIVDGRGWAERRPGTWVGPTVIVRGKGAEAAEAEEIFGPVLMVVKVGGAEGKGAARKGWGAGKRWLGEGLEAVVFVPSGDGRGSNFCPGWLCFRHVAPGWFKHMVAGDPRTAPAS